VRPGAQPETSWSGGALLAFAILRMIILAVGGLVSLWGTLGSWAFGAATYLLFCLGWFVATIAACIGSRHKRAMSVRVAWMYGYVGFVAVWMVVVNLV
jgi:hypothetical protein